MKNNNKILSVIFPGLCLLITILSVSCYPGDAYKKEIYCDPEFIAADEDSYSFVGRTESSTDRSIALSFNGFSGKETILRMEGAIGQSLNMTLNSNLTHGDFKICLVDPDRNVITILENSSYEQFSVKLYQGEYRIIIVGINADGEIEILKENI